MPTAKETIDRKMENSRFYESQLEIKPGGYLILSQTFHNMRLTWREQELLLQAIFQVREEEKKACYELWIRKENDTASLFIQKGGEYNFAYEPTLAFSDIGLYSFICEMKLPVHLPPEYIQTQERWQGIEKQLRAIPTEERNALQRLESEIIHANILQYARAVIPQIGEQWMRGFREKIRRFVEQDAREDPDACGPYLINKLRICEIPQENWAIEPRRFPGCFRGGERRHLKGY